MEILEFSLLFSALIVISCIVIVKLFRTNSGPKTSKKVSEAANSSVSDMYEVYNNQVKDVLKVKDNALRSMQQKLRQYEGDQSEESEGSTTQISWEDIKAIAKKKGVSPLILEIPTVKKNIMKFTKGMSIAEAAELYEEIDKVRKGGKLEMGVGATVEGKEPDAIANYFKQNRDALI